MTAVPVAALVPLAPLAGAAIVALPIAAPLAAWVFVAAAAVAFAFACALPGGMQSGGFLLVDPLSAHFALLTALVGLGTAWFSRFYIAAELAAGRLDARRVRQYHVLALLFLAFLLLAILSDNLGVAWASIEAATIAAVLVVGTTRTAAAIEASWKYFILGGVGIALALFGTIVLYLAALPALGPGLAAMSWSALTPAAPLCRGTLLNVAFTFLLIGYGTKAGLAPLHTWMPDAHAEGPTPISAVLSGSMLNVGLLMILRVRTLLDRNDAAIAPGPPMLALGFASLLLATLSLWRRRDVKRFFAFSSIEHNGIATIAFGLGGPSAAFAGLLHMTLHTLGKAAVFQCVGHAAQLKGGQAFSDISGLLARHRALGATLALAILAIAGMPPFGLFSTEFLLLTEVVRRAPWLAVPLALGVLLGGWALLARLLDLCFGPPAPDRGPAPPRVALLPAIALVVLVAGAGLLMPEAARAWFAAIAESLE